MKWFYQVSKSLQSYKEILKYANFGLQKCLYYLFFLSEKFAYIGLFLYLCSRIHLKQRIREGYCREERVIKGEGTFDHPFSIH